jgi:hypothetical protein
MQKETVVLEEGLDLDPEAAEVEVAAEARSGVQRQTPSNTRSRRKGYSSARAFLLR